jgi:hypothetical protein
MLDAIRFLEQAGRDHLSADDYVSAVAALDVSGAQKQALLDGNHAALADLLKARPSMFFGVFAPEEAPEEAPLEDQPDEPDEQEFDL